MFGMILCLTICIKLYREAEELKKEYACVLQGISVLSECQGGARESIEAYYQDLMHIYNTDCKGRKQCRHLMIIFLIKTDDESNTEIIFIFASDEKITKDWNCGGTNGNFVLEDMP